MPIKTGDRHQPALLPSSIEDYVGTEDRVRAYDAFIDYAVEAGINLPRDTDMGRPLYDPKTMLKLLAYSYSYGVRSSRQIERSCHHNLSFIWLTGGLKPDHKTIASFRRRHTALLKDILKQCVRFCLKSGLIDGNVLFLDGTKIRANAGLHNSWTPERCRKVLERMDQKIEALLAECEAADQSEEGQTDHVRLSSDLKESAALREQVRKIHQELKNEDRSCHNTTDPDCATMKSRQGVHAAYNVQQSVDDKHGLIVHTDVVSQATDIRQFADQVEKIEQALPKPPVTVCADAGYACTEEIKKPLEKGIDVVVPSNAQAAETIPGPFHHDAFSYNLSTDTYLCPEGQTLEYSGVDKPGISRAYGVPDPLTCRACRHFGVCTSSPRGRKIKRLIDEDVKKRVEARYASPEGQAIYRRRKERAELPFGFIKRALKADSFLLRGRQGVLAEASLWAASFNLTRLITLLGGVRPLVEKFQT